MTDVECTCCRANLEPGAVKCRACGEWVDGRWRLSDAGKVCLALIAAELFGMGAMAASWVPAMRAMLTEFGGPLPRFTTIVLAPWWLPVWMAAVVLGVVLSLTLVVRTRPRLALLAGVLTAGFVIVVATWWGVHLPISNLAESIPAE